MDSFDSLSNNELREQLKSHGLGNFPVTDTTRNLLIKKLRNAVGGGPKPVKSRRETISAAKIPSDETESDVDSMKGKARALSNRRTTIAAGSVPKAVSNPITNGISANGQSTKAVSERPKSPSRRSAAPKSTENIQLKHFADNSDDDLVAAVEAAESKTRKIRSSRSPSLTKSSVVTTSYKHTIGPLVETNDDDVVLVEDNSDAEYNSNMLGKVRRSTPTTKISAPSDRRKNLQLGPSVTTTTTTPNPIEKYPSEDSISAYRRRYTTNTPIANRAGTSTAIDPDEDILNRVETPYLSDFTRRLAELKATPFADMDDFKSPKTSTSTYKTSTHDYRSSVYGANCDRVREKLSQQKPPSAWSSFEKKIRLPLLILLVLFAIVFVYVFFFSNY